MDQEIIAQQGDSLYLIGDKRDRMPSRVVRLLDTDKGKLGKPYPLHLFLAQGYWQPYKGDQGALYDLMTRAGLDPWSSFSTEPTPI